MIKVRGEELGSREPTPHATRGPLSALHSGPQGSANTASGMDGTAQDRVKSLTMTVVYTLFMVGDYWFTPVQNCGGVLVSGRRDEHAPGSGGSGRLRSARAAATRRPRSSSFRAMY